MNSLFTQLFNLKEKIYHRTTEQEIEIIKKSNLFSLEAATFFTKIAKLIRLVKYREGELILKEGEAGDDLYFILEGTVRVFTYDSYGELIPLVILNKGDYFGEYALLGLAQESRNANVEAITDVTLMKISATQLLSMHSLNPETQQKLRNTWYQQALLSLSLPTKYYNEIAKLIHETRLPEKIALKKDDLIFSKGDLSDYVYLILKGEVKILIQDPISQNIAPLILHKGHLFGELGILKNKPRAATAIANENCQLLKIKGEFFLEFLSKHPELTEILSEMQHIYKIPLLGSVEQYIGTKEAIGMILTNIYRMDDGRVIISSNMVSQNICMFSTINVPEGKTYQFEKSSRKIELSVNDNKITGLKAYGMGVELPKFCRMLLEGTVISEEVFKKFEITANIQMPEELETFNGSEIICECLLVTKKQIQDQINKGITTVEGLSEVTGACTACKGCEYKIKSQINASN